MSGPQMNVQAEFIPYSLTAKLQPQESLSSAAIYRIHQRNSLSFLKHQIYHCSHNEVWISRTCYQ